LCVHDETRNSSLSLSVFCSVLLRLCQRVLRLPHVWFSAILGVGKWWHVMTRRK
jgi:hypothetical protein